MLPYVGRVVLERESCTYPLTVSDRWTKIIVSYIKKLKMCWKYTFLEGKIEKRVSLKYRGKEMCVTLNHKWQNNAKIYVKETGRAVSRQFRSQLLNTLPSVQSRMNMTDSIVAQCYYNRFFLPPPVRFPLLIISPALLHILFWDLRLGRPGSMLPVVGLCFQSIVCLTQHLLVAC